MLTTPVGKDFLKLWQVLQKVWSPNIRNLSLQNKLLFLLKAPLLVVLQRNPWAVICKWGISLSCLCKLCFICNHLRSLRPPHVSSPSPPVSTVSELLYCLQYFKFPLKCLAWQVVWPFPYSNYRLAGFLKLGFWRNNTFLPHLKGKKRDIWPAARTVNHTDRAQALSDALGY